MNTTSMHGIKIVYGGRGARVVGGTTQFDGRNFDIFDIVTGEKLLNVYGVQIDVRAGEGTRITVTYGAPFEYEGPADLVESTGD